MIIRNKFYYWYKHKLNRILCLFGSHHHKMGVRSRTGKAFGCLHCGKDWK